MNRNRRLDRLDHELIQRPPHAVDGQVARAAVHEQLANH
jgi:hypothetical protein